MEGIDKKWHRYVIMVTWTKEIFQAEKADRFYNPSSNSINLQYKIANNFSKQ